MDEKTRELIDRLEEKRSLQIDEYKYLIEHESEEARAYIAPKARAACDSVYGKDIYVRGLIEFSNYCRNNCYYCGIRGGNKNCERYRLSPEEILDRCRYGYKYGFRTIVLQSGEDMTYTDDIFCDIVGRIKTEFPDIALTISIGERPYESYKRYYDAGADRFLLRHETADEEHYMKLHPKEMSYTARMECIQNLREIGFAVGIGMMVGSPYQTSDNLAKDLKFIEEFQPEMCGVGPFIPHEDTPFRDQPPGSYETTLYLLSIVRLICPHLLLPATTALGTIHPKGREMGILAGANVMMPNLSPESTQEKYKLYNDKIKTGEAVDVENSELARRVSAIGYKIVSARGDCRKTH